MDQSTSSSRPSGLPRPSRLPVPRAGLRPSPSRESLQQSRLSVVNPRLRNAPSADQLSSLSSSKPRVSSTSSRARESSAAYHHDRDVFAQPLKHTPRIASHERLSRKPSNSVLREEQVQRPDLERDGEMAVEEQYSRKSRPSLSERAVETLQNIPSSPAGRKRTSSFYNPESPMRPPSRSSRPGSSYQNETSMGPPLRAVSSRPTSSTGT